VTKPASEAIVFIRHFEEAVKKIRGTMRMKLEEKNRSLPILIDDKHSAILLPINRNFV
jgi:hypothetical protein